MSCHYACTECRLHIHDCPMSDVAQIPVESFIFFLWGESPQLLGINLAVLSGTRKAMQCWGSNPGFCQARPALLPSEQFLISFKPNFLYLHFALCHVCLGDSNRSQGPTCLNKELKCLDISDFKGGP